MFIGISEIVNDSDSYGSIFNEIYDGDICRVEYILITRNKKIFSIIICISVLRKSSLRDHWSLRPVIQRHM